MSGALFLQFGLEKFLARPHLVRACKFPHLLHQLLRAAYDACFHQVRQYRDIARSALDTFGDVADTVPNIQADIPQQRQKVRKLVPNGIAVFSKQEKEINVRVRMQLSPAIAANGNHGQF